MEPAGTRSPAPLGFVAAIFDIEDAHALVEPLLRALEQRGVRVAVTSASKGAGAAIEAAPGAAIEAAPGAAIDAARELGVEPGHAVLLTDSPAGVQAGRRAGFGLIVALTRDGRAAELLDCGADVVVASLAHVTPEALDTWFRQNTRGLPSALARWPEIAARLRGRRPVVFLDYDGTLALIAENPDQAFLPEATRDVVRQLAARHPVAIVSGRHRDKIMDFVGMDDISYAGSHGFDISGPRSAIQWRQDPRLLEPMGRASAALRPALADVPGVDIEEKGFSTAVHYRRAAAADLPEIERRVDRVLAAEPELHKVHGKKVIEIRPRIDWHKGRAVLWLLQALGLDGDDVLPIYVGDDVTDEDAFAALGERGLGILVSERPRPSAATYAVRDPDEVRELLARLIAAVDIGHRLGHRPGHPDGSEDPA
jgi:trehalose 6-phosphate phosphatase